MKVLSSLSQIDSSLSTLKRVSVVISARDEARSIAGVVNRIKGIPFEYPYEIIVVDDGSKDQTAEVASSAGAIVVSHSRSLGKGAAMKKGVARAKGDIIVFLDADGEHDPRDISKVVLPILEKKADLVIGSRTLHESGPNASPATRRLANSLASFILSVTVSFILPVATRFRCPVKWKSIADVVSGFRAITKDGWHKLDLISTGFEMEIEMIYEAAKNGLTIANIPIRASWNSPISRLSIGRDGIRTLRLLARKVFGITRKQGTV